MRDYELLNNIIFYSCFISGMTNQPTKQNHNSNHSVTERVTLKTV